MSDAIPEDVPKEVPTSAWTLDRAKSWLRQRLREGITCPTCGQRAQIYKRKLNSGMARSLITMYREGGTGFIHVPTVVGAKSREEGKLRYWGLVEEEGAVREDGGRAGYWRVTPAGEAFVRRQSTVPKYALVFDSRLLHLEGEYIDIHEALGDGFDYHELMRS